MQTSARSSLAFTFALTASKAAIPIWRAPARIG
jgi:hypothetical protein